MSEGDPGTRHSLVERRARRIADAPSVTVGLAVTFLALSLVGAVVIRIADPDNFPSLGLAIWWALQTVTTVGYGDVVPTTTTGQVVGGLEMVIGISFISFLTAGVTSAVIQRVQARTVEEERVRSESDAQMIIDSLTQTRDAITELDRRLHRIESRLTG